MFHFFIRLSKKLWSSMFLKLKATFPIGHKHTKSTECYIKHKGYAHRNASKAINLPLLRLTTLLILHPREFYHFFIIFPKNDKSPRENDAKKIFHGHMMKIMTITMKIMMKIMMKILMTITMTITMKITMKINGSNFLLKLEGGGGARKSQNTIINSSASLRFEKKTKILDKFSKTIDIFLDFSEPK